MPKIRTFAIFLLVFQLYNLASFGLVYCSAKYRDKSNHEVTILLDLHYVASKEQNLKQLRCFLEELKKTNGPVHLIIESKFFFNFDGSQDLSVLYENLSLILGHDDVWSFSNSPQDASATTWIAWELPLCLLSNTNTELSYEFCDPRLRLDPQIATNDEAEKIVHFVNDVWENAKRESPKEIAEGFSTLFDTQTSDPESQLFDMMVASKLLDRSHKSTAQNKNTIVVCGAHHGHSLATKILPLLGFERMKSEALPLSEIRGYENGATISDVHLQRSCELLGLIN